MPNTVSTSHGFWSWIIISVGLCLFLAGCQTSLPSLASTPLFERALITPEHIETSIRAEQNLAKTYSVLPTNGEAWFTVLPGRSRIIVVAPHATQPTRDGKLRFADEGTGSLAIMLNQLADVTVLYTTLASPSDPNFYDENDFKQRLRDLVQYQQPILVLDLHGSHSYRPYDIDFGTMEGKALLGHTTFLSDLAEALRQQGVSNFSQDYFSAAKSQTITKWVSALGTPCIQLEINSTWLSASRENVGGHRYAQLLQGLVRYINRLDKSGDHQ